MRKIYCAVLLSAIAVSGATYTYGQSKKKEVKRKSSITIGFQGGRELLFNSSPLIHSRQSKVHYGISKDFVLRKSIGNHFKAEMRLNEVSYPLLNAGLTGLNKYTTTKLNIPLTLQYHPLCCGAKINPFCGMGLQYNLNPESSATNSEVSSFKNNGTKYISILFTQGVTYEISTKISLEESIHFIPGTVNKNLGFDVGIGYKLP